jgi:hypothetical protein
LHGVLENVSPQKGNRVVCYCDDCQAFAHYLGHADRILDAYGGSDIFQVSPARLKITAGAEHLACMRLSPKGLLRWYADCCKTPIGNTMPTRQFAFVGLVHSCFDAGAQTRDKVLGPVRGRVFRRFAGGEFRIAPKQDRIPFSMLLRVAGLIALWRIRGDHKRSPFFDRQTGEPIITPYMLTKEERQKLKAAVNGS